VSQPFRAEHTTKMLKSGFEKSIAHLIKKDIEALLEETVSLRARKSH